MILEIKNLSFSFNNHVVLDNVNLTIDKPGVTSILGSNGAGKTTLFRIILGIYKGKNGEVKLNSREVSLLKNKEIADLISYIPQIHTPVFNYKVIDVVLMGFASTMGIFSNPSKKNTEMALSALRKLGIEKLAQQGYMNLSGGERQLVLIARAMVKKSKFLIMDEPTSNLDYGNQIKVLNIIKNLASEGYYVLISTHNPQLAFLYSDDIVIIKDNKIICFEDKEDLFNNKILGELYNVDLRTFKCKYEEKEYGIIVPK